MTPSPTTSKRIVNLVTLSLLITLVGCTLSPERDSGTDKAASERDRQLAAILESELYRSDDLATFSLQVTHDSVEVRRAAVRALGRLQDAKFVDVLVKRLEAESDASIVEEIAFALGQIHDWRALVPLHDLLAHDNWRLRMRAAEAIGKLKKPSVGEDGEAPTGDAVLALIEALEDRQVEVRCAAALALWRHEDSRAIPHLVRHLDPEEDPEVRWRATYALMKLEDVDTLVPLFEQLTDPNPWVRTFAAQGMYHPVPKGAQETLDLIEALRVLLGDEDSFWTARVQAVRALGKIREQHEKDSRIRNQTLSLLLERVMRESHPLVLEALFQSVAVVQGPLEQHRLQRAVHTPTNLTGQRAAIRAYGKVGGDRGMPEIIRFIHDPEPLIRVAAAKAVGHGGPRGITALRDHLDPKREEDVRVRAAVVEALTEIATSEAWDLVRKAADEDPDMAVRGTAVMHYCEKKPQGWVDSIAVIYNNSQGEEFWDVRQEILKSLHKENKTRALGPLLKLAAKDPVFSVRQLAAELGGEEGAVAPAEPKSAPYPLLTKADLRGGENPHVTFETSRGDIVMELYLEEAPRHVSSIIYLARKGFYDDLNFHRVVPAFVIQGGDPRRDGWGAGDYFLPDEINPVPYLRGTLGMPKSTKDDGGCQIFVTHLPTPHLDGRYTVFGRVVQGMDIVDAIEVGDKIVRATVDEAQFATQ